ncbi:MAG: hypothetical protein JWO77_3077 [Ilumatobacteraceae bacterium]|nr:hypothetical protein [Ilumatobacteraceae bacterium]
MSVKVFAIRDLLDDFQTLRVDSDGDEILDAFCFGGRPAPAGWEPPPLYPDPLNLAIPDICSVGAFAILVLRPGVYDLLFDWVAHEERIPLVVDGRELDGINVLSTPNVLDVAATEAIGGPTGLITRYAFLKRRFAGNRSLFRLPGTDYGPLYCWEDTDDLEEGFRFAVESNGITGLWFEECWDSAIADHPFSAFG